LVFCLADGDFLRGEPAVPDRIDVPRLGLGCVKLGSAATGGSTAAVRLVDRALDHGVAFFDTAAAYGDGTSERIVGRAVRAQRSRVVIATKAGYRFTERSPTQRALRWLLAPWLASRARNAASSAQTGATAANQPARASYAAQDFSSAFLRTSLEGSLRRLNTDYIDIFQLHGPPRVCESDVVHVVEEFMQAGKVRAFGVGLESLESALAWLDVKGVSWIQIPFGILDPQAGMGLIAAANAKGVNVIVRGVFAAGLLADIPEGRELLLDSRQRQLRKDVRALASGAGLDPLVLAAWYARSQPGVRIVLIGASSRKQLDENIAALAASAPTAEVAQKLDALLGDYLTARVLETKLAT
jgi:aryl-alcohol dehydrogenase-like predicted oxidoreductase